MSNFKVYKPFNKEEPRVAPASPKFLVNDNGHLQNRQKEEGTHSFPEFEPNGKASFGFTPMGYVRHEVRPNVKIAGVRSELGHTNPQAFHFLHKDNPENHQRISTSTTGCNNERTLTTKTKYNEFYNEKEEEAQNSTLTRLQHVNQSL
jgi:hypothetical protein